MKKKFKVPFTKRGKKAEVKSSPKKNRPQDYALTYSDTTGKDGLIKTGMFAGCPSWVAFYISQRKPWSQEDDDETYAVRPEDSKAFPGLKDAGSVIIRTHDGRKQHKGFRFEVISALGPAVVEEALVEDDRSGLESTDLDLDDGVGEEELKQAPTQRSEPELSHVHDDKPNPPGVSLAQSYFKKKQKA